MFFKLLFFIIFIPKHGSTKERLAGIERQFGDAKQP